MTLKQYLFILFILLSLTIWLSCNKSNELDNSVNIEDCQVGDFYARMLVNGNCKVPEFAWIIVDIMGTGSNIIGFGDSGQFDEVLKLTFVNSFKVGEKIYFNDIDPRISLNVNEGADAQITGFYPKLDIDSNANWVMIDSINADTSIVIGRFEAILYQDSPHSLYDGPEKLVITDGQFRVEKVE